MLPYRKCGKGDPGGHGDRYGNAAVGRGAITQPTLQIISPTIHRTSSREGTAMHNTRTNRLKCDPSGHRNGHRSVATGCRAVAEAALLITSPTESITRTIEGTGVFIPRRNRGEVTPAAWCQRRGAGCGACRCRCLRGRGAGCGACRCRCLRGGTRPRRRLCHCCSVGHRGGGNWNSLPAEIHRGEGSHTSRRST